jgi:hypothetical protein
MAFLVSCRGLRRRICEGFVVRVRGCIGVAVIAVGLWSAAARAKPSSAGAPSAGEADEAGPLEADRSDMGSAGSQQPSRPRVLPVAVERARADAVDDRYQPELPRPGPEPAINDGLGPRAGGESASQTTSATRDHDEAEGSPPVRIAMWGLVIIVAVLAGAWLTSELGRYGGDAELPDVQTQQRMAAASEAILDRPLGDADDLAAHGAFAPAIHTLLLRTLHELAHTAGLRLPPAATSREILARVPLLADSRTALADLILAVEITHFGDAPASAADYARCRAQFQRFAAAFRGASAGGPEARAA